MTATDPLERYRTKLKELLRAIENSCTAFDAGDGFEAIRVGTALRVLFHSTRLSTSLIDHLGNPAFTMLSTGRDVGANASSVMMLSTLCMFSVGATEISWRAPLGDGGLAEFIE
jgi:hypothetical protein